MSKNLCAFILCFGSLSLFSSVYAEEPINSQLNKAKSSIVNSPSSFNHISTSNKQNIALVDLQYLLQKSPQVNAMREELKRAFAPKQQNIASLENNLRQDIELLQKNQQNNKDKSSVDNLRKKIQEEQNKLQEQQINFQKDLLKAQENAFRTVMDKVKSKIADISKAKNIDLVLIKNSVIYNNSKVNDITNEVLASLK